MLELWIFGCCACLHLCDYSCDVCILRRDGVSETKTRLVSSTIMDLANGNCCQEPIWYNFCIAGSKMGLSRGVRVQNRERYKMGSTWGVRGVMALRLVSLPLSASRLWYIKSLPEMLPALILILYSPFITPRMLLILYPSRHALI